MRIIRAAVASLLLLCPFAAAQADAAQDRFERVFGGAPGQPGFRVEFTTAGASIKQIHLTDHLAEVENEDGTRDEYLLADVVWVDPRNPQRGYWSWLGVEEAGRERWFEESVLTATWRVVEDGADRIAFEVDAGTGLVLEKRFTHVPGTRHLGVELALRATAQHERAGQVLTLRVFGLAVRSPRSEYTLGQNVALAVAELWKTEDETEFATGRANGEPGSLPFVDARPDAPFSYAGSTNRFFGAFLYPGDESGAAALARTRILKVPDVEQADTPPWSVPVVEFYVDLEVPSAGAESRARFGYYLGPKSKRVFELVPDYVRFDQVVDNDLAPGCFCEVPGTRTMARFLLWLLGRLYDVVGNWGIAIMILTVIVRSALVPLNFRMQKSMRAYGAKAAKLKPKLDAIQKRYANDKKALQQAMLEFQREHKMFPPIGGCLPMFVTIPVFIGLFTALRTSYDLRQQPFFGWIDDLSQPDQLFGLAIPYVEHFNLLPILMVGLWWLLQSSTPLPSDPQQRQMMKIMRFMPLMFGVMLYHYASGLMVYMITSSLFALVESRITKRILGPVSPEAAAFGTPQI